MWVVWLFSVYWLKGDFIDLGGVPRILAPWCLSLPDSLQLPGAWVMSGWWSCLLVRWSIAGREKRNSDSPWASGAEQRRGSGSPTLCWAWATGQIQNQRAEDLEIGTYSQSVVCFSLFFFNPEKSMCTLWIQFQQLSLWELSCNTPWNAGFNSDLVMILEDESHMLSPALASWRVVSGYLGTCGVMDG